MGDHVRQDRQDQRPTRSVSVQAGGTDAAAQKEAQQQENEGEAQGASLDVEANELIVRPFEQPAAAEWRSRPGERVANRAQAQTQGMLQGGPQPVQLARPATRGVVAHALAQQPVKKRVADEPGVQEEGEGQAPGQSDGPPQAAPRLTGCQGLEK